MKLETMCLPKNQFSPIDLILEDYDLSELREIRFNRRVKKKMNETNENNHLIYDSFLPFSFLRPAEKWIEKNVTINGKKYEEISFVVELIVSGEYSLKMITLDEITYTYPNINSTIILEIE